LSFIRFWGPVLVYMGLIFWSSSEKRPDVLTTAPDYLLHGAAYAALSLLSVRAVAKGLTSPLKLWHVLGGIAIAALYGVSDEWHQLHVPGREASLADLLADCAGASVGGAFSKAVSAFRNGAVGESR
jgi:VanZ family protein